MKSLILSIAFVLLCIGVFAQGEITIHKDPRVDKLVSKHIAFNEAKDGMDGYRIQIYFDSGNNSRRRANSMKARFLANYSDVGAYLMFQDPNYKVRVGDFRTRLEAQGFLNEIIGDFESAFIVIDKINLPDLDAGDVIIEHK